MMTEYEIKTQTSIRAAIEEVIKAKYGNIPLQIIGKDNDLKVIFEDDAPLSGKMDTNITDDIASIYAKRG